MGSDLTFTGQIIFLDPPEHTELRHLVSRAFTPRHTAVLEDRIRRFCADMLDAQSGRDGFDYVQDFGAKLPSMVISSLLGVPVEDQETFRHTTDRLFHIEPGVGMVNDISMTAGQGDRAVPRRAHRRAHGDPQDDLTSLGTGGPAPRPGQRRLRHLLLAAGTETVARLLGWAAVVLAAHPDQRAELAADPSLIPNAVEELLRYEAPSPVQGRWTTRDVELHDTVIPANSKVLLLTGSAGRDERAYPDADRFDIHREHRQPRVVRVRHPLLRRRRARPARGPHRARGDAEALPDVGGRPRPGRAPAHEHRPRLRAGAHRRALRTHHAPTS